VKQSSHFFTLQILIYVVKALKNMKKLKNTFKYEDIQVFDEIYTPFFTSLLFKQPKFKLNFIKGYKDWRS
jgi:hypothetical protein